MRFVKNLDRRFNYIMTYWKGFFFKGKILDAKIRKQFLAKLKLKLKKLLVV
jgi:hypothetical protein